MGSIRFLVRLMVLGSLAVLVVLAYYGFTLPVPRLLDPPTQPAVILAAADGAVFAGRGVLTGRRWSVADLPGHLIDAVIAIEDRRFRDHDGIDPRGILRALSENLRAGGIRQDGHPWDFKVLFTVGLSMNEPRSISNLMNDTELQDE